MYCFGTVMHSNEMASPAASNSWEIRQYRSKFQLTVRSSNCRDSWPQELPRGGRLPVAPSIFMDYAPSARSDGEHAPRATDRLGNVRENPRSAGPCGGFWRRTATARSRNSRVAALPKRWDRLRASFEQLLEQRGAHHADR